MDMKFTSVEDKTIKFSAYNNTGATRGFNFGIGILDNAGQITQLGDYLTANSLDDGWGYSSRSCNVPTIKAYANTTQRIVPISRDKSTTTWFVSGNPDLNYVAATFDANGVPHLLLHPAVDLHSGAFTVPTSKYVNEAQTIKVPLTNHGDEFYGTLYLFASTSDSKGNYVSRTGLTILQNSTETAAFEWKPTATGTYNLWVATDSEGANVVATSTLTITSDASLSGKSVVITAIAFNGLDNNSWTFNTSTGVRTVDVYDTDSLYGRISITNLTESDISNYKLKIQYEEYNASTGTYTTKVTKGVYTLTTFKAGSTRNLNVKDVHVSSGSTYRLHILRSDTGDEVDTRYLVNLKTPKTSLSGSTVTVSAIADQQYTGSPITPAVTVMRGNQDITSYCDITYGDNLNVGTALVSIRAKQSSNFTGYRSTSFNITKAELTMTANNTTIAFGDTPDFTCTYSGWKGNDDSTLVIGTPTFTTDYNVGSDVGTYTVTPTGGVTTNNYNITFAPGVLTVNKADAVIPVLPKPISNLIYDGTPKTLITAGTAIGGTLLYSLDQISWDPELPMATEIGEYIVYYRVEADYNHNDNPGGSLTAAILDDTAIDQVAGDNAPAANGKLLINGHLYIRHNGNTYSVTGQDL